VGTSDDPIVEAVQGLIDGSRASRDALSQAKAVLERGIERVRSGEPVTGAIRESASGERRSIPDAPATSSASR